MQRFWYSLHLIVFESWIGAEQHLKWVWRCLAVYKGGRVTEFRLRPERISLPYFAAFKIMTQCHQSMNGFILIPLDSWDSARDISVCKLSSETVSTLPRIQLFKLQVMLVYLGCFVEILFTCFSDDELYCELCCVPGCSETGSHWPCKNGEILFRGKEVFFLLLKKECQGSVVSHIS